MSGRCDRGFGTLQFVIASSFALVFFAALANVVVVQLASGALRSALDQGARAGALTGDVAACEDRVSQVVDDLLGGTVGETAHLECVVTGSLMEARGSLEVESWTPFVGAYSIDLSAGHALDLDG